MDVPMRLFGSDDSHVTDRIHQQDREEDPDGAAFWHGGDDDV